MITKEAFLEKYNISEELFISSGISWEELCDIYDDFNNKRHGKYDDILNKFTKEYLKGICDGIEPVKVHSILSRVKDPEHLIAKVVRKKQENYRKYKKLDASNYEKFITDLIGIRCLVLFKSDWKSFHTYITSKFENDVSYYVRDSLLDFDENDKHFYIAEKPKVHIRNGDSRKIYDELLPPDCVLDGKVYRSVHYIIKYRGVYIEIQVRTLFEEGWGEVDHNIVYPYFQNDPVLKEYTELLNRLSGLADEMSDFFYRLKELEKEHIKITSDDRSESLDINGPDDSEQQNIYEEFSDDPMLADTPMQCLHLVLNQ